MRHFTALTLLILPFSQMWAEPQKASDALLYPINPPRTVKETASPHQVISRTKRPDPIAGFAMSFMPKKTADTANKEYFIKLHYSGDQVFDPKRITVCIEPYDKASDGTILKSGAQMITRWTSQAIDFSEPEILEVTISKPNGNHYGIVSSMYYDGTLLAATSEPADLLKRFPPPQTK